MADKYTVELDDSFISKLYEMTDSVAPSSSDITLVNLKKQLYDVGLMIKHMKDEIEDLKSKKKRKSSGGSDSSSSSSGYSGGSSSSQSSSSASAEVDLASFAGNVSNVQKASEMAQLGMSMNYTQPTLQFIVPSGIRIEKKQNYD